MGDGGGGGKAGAAAAASNPALEKDVEECKIGIKKLAEAVTTVKNVLDRRINEEARAVTTSLSPRLAPHEQCTGFTEGKGPVKNGTSSWGLQKEVASFCFIFARHPNALRQGCNLELERSIL